MHNHTLAKRWCGLVAIVVSTMLTACAPPLELSYHDRIGRPFRTPPDMSDATVIEFGATVHSVSTGMASMSISGEMSTLTARIDDGARLPGHDDARDIELRYHAGVDQELMRIRRGDRLGFRFTSDGRFVDVHCANNPTRASGDH